jgi:superfamily II DNA or RNA helicase
LATERRGGDLFIVDNSVSGWTGLRYLEEWCVLAKSFDIATGFFEVGSLLALDGKWQGLDKIRILMGGEVSSSTRKALLEAVTARARSTLDDSLEDDKDENPFLQGVPAIAQALHSGQIECRVYDKGKFHAKTYITHAKLDVIGAQALVGSSNFTRPGLTQNIELNIQVQSGREVAQLQEWFEDHWIAAQDVTAEVLTVVERHIREYSPFDVYAKALHEFFKGHEITASEWEESESRLFHLLARYQQEGYWALMKIAKQHGGAFLCDGVGLGKTFIGLMLIERLVVHENKRVVLFAPKTAKESVWEPHLRKWLPLVGGASGGADFSNLAVFSHTDLNRKGDFPERFERIAELADVVIIDEAHHFRNPGRQSSPDSDRAPSRYYELFDMLNPAIRPKTLFMLTATPINNHLSDFRHMIELFSRRDQRYFARTLGINNLQSHFINLEKELRRQLDTDSTIDLSESLSEVQQLLASDDTFQQLVVQRSRAYAKESQTSENGAAPIFPEREAPKVAEYSIKQTYGSLLDMVEKAFEKQAPLFTLPIYYPLAYYKGSNESIDPVEENRQRQVVGLIRTQFLKRFESSVSAFESSCNRLMRKLLAFVEVHATSEEDRAYFDRWRFRYADIIAPDPQLTLWDSDGDVDDDVIPREFLEDVPILSREEYAVDSIITDTYIDLAEIAKFLREVRQFQPKHDDKLNKLTRLLKTKELAAEKVLIFTEFADTARYLEEQLKLAGIEGIDEVDSTSKLNRAEVIQRFAPYYNGTNSATLATKGIEETRVLISTDVLSEGLNLQDATRLSTTTSIGIL